jgi:putative toxin-antitoxin system antitoxin component (TIGR02293 family)
MGEDLKGCDVSSDGLKIRRGLAVELPADSEARPRQQADLERIVERAVEVIGTREEAMRWLGTPVRALGYATPISLLHDAASEERVLAVLTQLEHGVL